jgi:predicted DNA repair protein MutK
MGQGLAPRALAPVTKETHTMAGSGLLLLLDDIASILDDVALLTKAATRKTAGVLGDDLALNAQQVSGVRAERELPVVWAVAKGSLLNKAILVPAALAISAFAPWAVTPLLMVGGAFLCFEGFEKIAHRVLHPPAERQADHAKLAHAVADPAVDLVAFEKDKIKGAVRTDFILSAEIIIIALGTVEKATFVTQLVVLVGIALLMTVGVYGLVAGIVKLDDAGLHLSEKSGAGAWSRLQRWLGAALLGLAPYLMKGLAVAGTAAMFLVGGGILVHGVHALQPWVDRCTTVMHDVAGVGPFLGALAPMLVNAVVGLVAGAMLLAIVSTGRRLMSASAPS